MHRPRLAELEPLVAHAERLPVDGVDGQDYLRCSSYGALRSVALAPRRRYGLSRGSTYCAFCSI